MAKPSKLKRAINLMRAEVQGYYQEIDCIKELIKNKEDIIDKLVEIDGEKNEKNRNMEGKNHKVNCK